ncbi:MAG: type II toxin-antitoxin system HicA family toxin [Vulcanimicrobiaceae bacterium]
MPKLPRISARDFARALQRAGFELLRQSGSHAFFTSAQGRIGRRNA